MSLNFVSGTPGRSLNMWSPQRPVDYAEACKQGRIYAGEMAKYLQASRNPLIVGAVMKAIAEAGEFSGVEAGFCSQLGQLLSASAE